MKAVVTYEGSTAPMSRILEVYPRHKIGVDAFHADGRLIAVGTWANPGEGSMGIFRDRAAAEAFVAQDPFVKEGLVGKYTIRDWNETLLK